ncbi:MAG: hypothetical protein ACRD4O_16135, partial [Bryobacteraceae bacterium]
LWLRLCFESAIYRQISIRSQFFHSFQAKIRVCTVEQASGLPSRFSNRIAFVCMTVIQKEKQMPPRMAAWQPWRAAPHAECPFPGKLSDIAWSRGVTPDHQIVGIIDDVRP